MISIVIPAYNEAQIIERSVKLISDTMGELDWELIVVDDCSKDDTVDRLLRMKEEVPNLRVIRQERNQGPGAAFRRGFKEAKGDIILTNDADSSFSPMYIPKLLEYINDYDVVIGSQHMRGARMVNVPWARVVASKSARFLDRLFLNVRLTTLSSFFVAYKADVIKNLDFKGNGFDAQCEILATLSKRGYRIKEVPCMLKWSKGKKRKSSLKLFREIKKRSLLWLRLRKEFSKYRKG